MNKFIAIVFVLFILQTICILLMYSNHNRDIEHLYEDSEWVPSYTEPREFVT